MNHEQRIPCPVCNTPINFYSFALIQGERFSCTGCGAVVGLPKESVPEATEATEAIQKFTQFKNSLGKRKG